MKYEQCIETMLREYGIERTNIEDKCFVCGDSTPYIDTYFKAPSCSQKCSRLMVREILREVRSLHEVIDRLEKRLDLLMR